MKKEIKIGLILIFALGSLIWGLNFLKGKNFFSNTKNYYVIYDDVSGLLESNGVYVKGYKVGYVSSISFSDSTLSQLKVVLAIKNDLDVPVKFVGLGEKLDDLQPFSPEAFAQGLFDVDISDDEEVLSGE